MQRNTLYMAIGALVVVVIGLGFYMFREESKPAGIELRLDESGMSVEQN